MQVGVAVIDTGIYKHRDFGDRIIGFADFVNGKMIPYDDSGHGTHVSGIIAGNGEASNGKYRGVAPEATIISVKVLDNVGNGRINNVIKGLKWIRSNRELYNIRVANISFGTTPDNEMEEESTLIRAVEQLWDDGIVVIAAAGNSGPGRTTITAPGISRKIITVGAFDDMNFTDSVGNQMRYYSGRGPTKDCIIKPEVVVAGANIVACSNKKNSYSVKSGTSMAAPIISGAVARLLIQQPELTPKEVKLKIRACCKKIDIPDNQQGWGALDIVKFVKPGPVDI
jgi:serine protease AprX